MKRVLIEMERLKNPYSGLGQFCLNIGEQFQKLNPSNLQLNFYLPKTQLGIFGQEFNYIKHSARHKFLPFNSNDYNLYHCVHQDSRYLPSNKNTKLILTVHDMNFLEKYRGIRLRKKLADLQRRVDRANVITVISKFTESIVSHNLQLNNKPICVIYNGNSLKIFKNPGKPDFIIFKDFIFTIGIISPKKNFHVLLPLLQNDKHLNLVIAGENNTDYAREIAQISEKMGVRKQLHFPGTINDEEKYWLYKNCKAFVFPSLTEGFGLPVVEAMSVGKPVFLSDLTSLPEVGGPEAFYWSDFAPERMIDVFEKGLNDFNEEKARRSIAWAKRFSWEKAAQAYLNLYAEI